MPAEIFLARDRLAALPELHFVEDTKRQPSRLLKKSPEKSLVFRLFA
jgi:hypothetical protein